MVFASCGAAQTAALPTPCPRREPPDPPWGGSASGRDVLTTSSELRRKNPLTPSQRRPRRDFRCLRHHAVDHAAEVTPEIPE